MSVLDSGRCFFMHIALAQQKCENVSDNSTQINISLQPLEFIYRKSYIDNIINFCEKINKVRSQGDNEATPL